MNNTHQQIDHNKHTSSAPEMVAHCLNSLPDEMADIIYKGAKKGLWGLRLETSFDNRKCEITLFVVPLNSKPFALHKIETDGLILFDIMGKKPVATH